jgi:uncharacterized protein (TIGR02996 family)
VSRLDDLRAAILAAPDDDEPRLIYADALVEEGNPRGELIQIQVALAAGADDPAFMKREDELLARWRQTWANAYRGGHPMTYRRGFVWEASYDEDLFAEQPVESLYHPSFSEPPSVLAKMRRLEVRWSQGEELAAAIRDDRLPPLRGLSFTDDRGEEWDRSVVALRALAGGPLEELSLVRVVPLPELRLRSLSVRNADPGWILAAPLEGLEALVVPDVQQGPNRPPPRSGPTSSGRCWNVWARFAGSTYGVGARTRTRSPPGRVSARSPRSCTTARASSGSWRARPR